MRIIRSCFECEHFALTPSTGGFCITFNEHIDSEVLAAEDCLAYEPTPAMFS